MKTNLLLAIFLCVLFFSVKSEESKIVSPDGNLTVSISVENGSAFYSVTLGESTFLKKSPLGLKTNIGDYTQGLSQNGSVKTTGASDTYELPNIKKSKVNYKATEGICSFSKDGENAFDVIYSLSSNTWAALGSGSFAFADRVWVRGSMGGTVSPRIRAAARWTASTVLT